MLLVGCMCFGLVLGWSGGFAGLGIAALAWRAGTGALAIAWLLAFGAAALLAALAGLATGTVAHELFAYGIRAGRRA